MSEWECGVCGYIHKGDQPPEKCPVCEAPEKMFTEKLPDSSEAEVSQKVDEQVDTADSQEPPPEAPQGNTSRRWRCTVCGYLHDGEEPPEKCPLCGADKSFFVEVDAEGKSLTGEDDNDGLPSAAETAAGVDSTQKSSTIFDKIATLSFNFHLHSIHTHFPNGLLPVIVAFLGLSIYFNIVSLETAAFYNSIAVLLALPVVILTGYIEWQKRYKGIKTLIFITKIICALVVLASVNVLVFWRVIDPAVASEGSLSQILYFAVAAVALGAAGIAGHLGGKLAFGSRS